MSLKEQVYSVLVVSSSEKINASLTSILPSKEYVPIHFVKSVSHAKQHVSERAYDFIIINAPLPDEFGSRFAIDVCSNKSTVAVLLVSADLYDETYEKVLPHGVLTLKKPTSVSMLNQCLDWMKVFHERLHKIEKKTVSLEDKMAEIRIVNRAKWALIDACKMTEDDAHRYIERQAMDRCVSKREIAEGILQTWG